MKAGHYYNQALKAHEILTKYHTKMFDLGGEESEHWCDELNHQERVLNQSLNWGKDDELFTEAAEFDTRLSRVDDHIKEYLSDIRYLKGNVISVGNLVEVIQEGDVVYYDKHAGHGIEYNNKFYFVIKASDIVLVD